jgi:hypothetical protein
MPGANVQWKPLFHDKKKRKEKLTLVLQCNVQNFQTFDITINVHVETCLCNRHPSGFRIEKEDDQELEVLMPVNSPAMVCVNFRSLDIIMTVHAEKSLYWHLWAKLCKSICG